MKKFINDPRMAVHDLLEGLVQSDPGLALLEGEMVVLRADIPTDPADRPVAVLSGGGSGHEPAHADYVGEGMLSGAIAGDVFTSPSTDAVHAAIRATAGPAGALLIVKNYTGDRLNFSLAAELARADGIPVEIVFVADDVALTGLVPRERRRGLAGTVLVHKIAGAAVAEGLPLDEVALRARAAAADVSTMGIALGACTVPTAGVPSFELAEDEIEFGLGIHGEKGVERTALQSAEAIVARIVGAIAEDLSPRATGPVGLMVNGLGGTPPMELAILAGHALSELRARGMEPRLIWTGNFMTALEMPGASITVLPLDAERERLLTAETNVRIWPRSAAVGAGTRRRLPRTEPDIPAIAAGPLTPALKSAAERVAARLVAAEPHLTDLDSRAGDGDLGASMHRGAEAILALPEAAYNTPADFLRLLGEALRRAIAGSSGPFYATALMRAAAPLEGKADPDPADWDAAFAAAVASVGEIGGAKPGDRTMVDALVPALDAWTATRKAGAAPTAALGAAAEAAQTGAAATASMAPKLGRAAYLGERAIGAPDGGAEAVAIWLSALALTHME